MAHTIDNLCNGCSACVRQCPTQSITGVRDRQHTIDARSCIDCSVCGLVCPVEAVTDARGRRVARLPRYARPRPVVHLDLCNGCGMCVDVCPFECRLVTGGPPYNGIAFLKLPLACVSCGECARACLKGAISMARVDMRTYDPRDETRRLELHLADHALATEGR